MEFVGIGAVAALGGALVYANLPTSLTIGAVAPTYPHLAASKLVPIRGTPDEKERVDRGELFTGESLFKNGPILVMAVRRPGCLFCRREAAELQTLLPLLKKNGIAMAAVVHETRGANKFKSWFTEGDVYLDTERHFYGPNERWLPIWMGFLRWGTYSNVYKAKRANVGGNLAGEGRLLGGVYLIADNNIVYTHLEKEWGDAANIDEVKAAVEKFAKAK
uniref:Peroxiredoxin-like 2A n=1 Tax=Caenorhabditis japonica TaxID=281687 RepID=A0A8R1DY18_CAEJA